jgi:hypothetical protein
MAMNQNIVSCAQDASRHPQGKIDTFTDPKRAVQFKQNSTRADIVGKGRVFVGGG